VFYLDLLGVQQQIGHLFGLGFSMLLGVGVEGDVFVKVQRVVFDEMD
jgi:hypothetical protein